MSPLIKFILLVALCTLSLAAPHKPNFKKGFTLKQSRIKQGYIRNGPHLTAKVYRKYGKKMPTDVKAAAAAVQSGTVIAVPNDEYDDAYLSPVTIGGQTLQLDFDTGSADTWTYSAKLPSTQQAGHSVYDPAKSSTASFKPNYTWAIVYGDGSSASGSVYTDTVQIGKITVLNQAVEVAEKLSASFTTDEDLDGLLGLGFSNVNTIQPVPQNTFFDNVKPSLSCPVFTVDLKYHAAGSYDFGYIDAAKHSGPIIYSPVNNVNGYWEIKSPGYAVGSSALVSRNMTTIVDTGTTLIYADTQVVSDYYKKVSGARYSFEYGGYVYSCKNATSMPSLTLMVEGYKAVVPGKHLNYGSIEAGSSLCYGGLQSNSQMGFSVWGDIFLKSQFVVFSEEGGAPKVGVAPKKY